MDFLHTSLTSGLHLRLLSHTLLYSFLSHAMLFTAILHVLLIVCSFPTRG